MGLTSNAVQLQNQVFTKRKASLAAVPSSDPGKAIQPKSKGDLWNPIHPPMWPIDPPRFPVFKPVATPATKASAQLQAIDNRCTTDLKTLDAAIAKREKGESWWQQLNDPMLRKLKAARSEIAQVQTDCKTAEGDLAEGMPAIPPMSDMMFQYHIPNYDAAETQINDIEGRLAHAQNLLQGAAQEPGAGTDPSGIRQVLGDLGISQSQAQAAQQDVWQGQDNAPTPWPGPINPVGPIDPIKPWPIVNPVKPWPIVRIKAQPGPSPVIQWLLNPVSPITKLFSNLL